MTKTKAAPALSVAFTVDRKTFAEAVGKVARFLPERPPVPVLGGILIDVGLGSLEVTVTDLEDTARVAVPADVDMLGRALVDGERFARIVRNCPGDTIRVAVTGSHATITSGRATYTLLTMPEDDYPDMSAVASVDMGGAKPAATDGFRVYYVDGRSLPLSYGQSFIAGFRKTWKASRTRKLYEPTDLEPGAWIEWTRHTRVADTITETEEVRGQVWSAAPGSRSVWALVEGERPVRVTEGKHLRTTHADNRVKYERYTSLDEFRDHRPETKPAEPSDVIRLRLERGEKLAA